MDGDAQKFDRVLTSVEHDANVKAMVAHVDYPVGSVTACDEVLHRLHKFKLNEPNKPVVVSRGALAASGGYYVACGADYLIAQPSTLTGFFFQAEDGIRDGTVTGVQTCALPI